MGGKIWTQDDLDYIHSNYRNLSHSELACKLGRTESSVQLKCNRLGLDKNNNEQIGDKNHMLTIIKIDGLTATFQCDCGNIVDGRLTDWRNNHKKSCGCLKSINRKGKGTTHGLTKHPLHGIWMRAKKKCYDIHYHRYQAGIEMLDEWVKNFQPFYDWAIANGWQENLKLERKNNSLGFNPDNCIFMNSSEARKRYEDRAIQTSLEKFGVEHRSQLEDERQRMRDEWANHREERAASIKKGVQDIHGVDNVFQLDSVKEQSKQTNQEKYGCDYAAQNAEIKEIIRQKVTKLIHNNKTATQYAKELGYAYTTFIRHIAKYGFQAAIDKPKHKSGLEVLFAQLLDKHNMRYNEQVWLKPYRPDFVINDSIIVETDGLFWHCDLHNQDNNYHKKKMEHYKSLGYSPLFFREDEINTKSDIVESILLNKLGLNSTRLFARKCDIKELDNPSPFFETHHLMGAGTGRALALFYNNEPVCAIRYISKQDRTEISRFCCATQTTVVGGYSRLIDKLNKPIHTFVDLRYGSGQWLENLGFQLQSCSLSFRWTNGVKTVHRMRFRGNIGYQEGWYKIWDCGQALYTR